MTSRLEVDLAEVFERYRRRLRVDGVGVSADVEAVERAARLLVRCVDWSGLERTKLGVEAAEAQGETMSLLLSIDDAALALQVSTKTVARLAKSGALPTVELGRAVRVRREDLAAYVAGLEVRAVSADTEHRAEIASLGREQMSWDERVRVDAIVAEMTEAAEHRVDSGPVRVVWRRDSQAEPLERRFGGRDEAQRFATDLAANTDPGKLVTLEVDDGAGLSPGPAAESLAVRRAQLERKRK